MAAKCSGRSAQRAVIRVSPTSMTTSTSVTACDLWRSARLEPVITTGRSRGRSDRVAATLRARRPSSERHQTSVRARTPSRLAIASGSATSTSSSTRFAHQAALCLAMPAANYDAPSMTRRPSPYGYAQTVHVDVLLPQVPGPPARCHGRRGPTAASRAGSSCADRAPRRRGNRGRRADL